MFEKDLTDLIRGMRANKKNESQYINQCIQEIKEEIRSTDQQKKMVAVQKLAYLQMLGYDISWAAFNFIEVMSQTRFTSKRIGYLAAATTFHEGTEVITLVTNLIRKDMTSNNIWDASVALNCLANICTPDLARDLAADVVSLLGSSRPYIRKKACLVLYKIFLKFPDALRPAFPKLKEKLEDPDPAVVAAAVTVVCELARKNPKNYIALSPVLFSILTNSNNNWMLIKIVKLFGALLPIEQRLAKKLVTPLTNIMNSTPAMSLAYECIQTCTIGLIDHLPTVKLCIVKLRSFVEDPDQNLKYLGLLALNNIMKIHPKAVSEHKDLIINCLDDPDLSIRARALDLLEGMVNKRNVADIIDRLINQIEKADAGPYKEAMVEKVITICSKNTYAHVTDFEWYISVLMELAHTRNTHHGQLIASQLLDVAIRVKVIRPFAVKSMISLLRESHVLADTTIYGNNVEVLYSAAWIVGEFSSYIDDYLGVVEALLQPSAVSLPGHIVAVYMQSLLKVFGTVAAGGVTSEGNLLDGDQDQAPSVSKTIDEEVLTQVTEVMQMRLPLFTQSQHLEVQERACFAQEVLNLFVELSRSGDRHIGTDIASLFQEQLNPVAPTAQKKVRVPEDLDLDSWINEPEPEPEFISDRAAFEQGLEFLSKHDDYSDSEDEKKQAVEREQQKQASRARQANSAFYLSGETQKKKFLDDDESDIPAVRTLTRDDVGLKVTSYKDNIRRSQKGSSKGRRNRGPAVEIMRNEEMPEGVDGSESEEEKKSGTGEITLETIDLSGPLRPDERLFTPTHRVVKNAPATTEKDKKDGKERKSRRHRDDKERRSGRKSRGDKDREGKDRKEEKAPTTRPRAKSESNQLIDLGDDILGGPAPASTDNRPRAGSVSASLSPKTLGSPSSGSYLEVGSPDPAEKKSKSRRSEKDREGRREGRDRRHRDKDREGRKESSSKSSSRTEGAPATAPVGSPVGSPKSTPKFKPLCSDENLGIIYETRVNPKESKKIMVSFAFKNLSQEHAISNIQFDIPSTMTISVASESSVKPVFTLQPGETSTHNVIFACSSISQPPKISGAISYQLGDEDTGRKDFQLVLPCSAFIIPVKLDKEQFIELLSSSSSSLSLASTDIKATEDFRNFVVALAMLIRVELIIAEAGASLYGKTVQGHHVFVYVKPQGSVHHVDIKSNDAMVATNLIAEVNKGFAK